jgi:hypothetical protein
MFHNLRSTLENEQSSTATAQQPWNVQQPSAAVEQSSYGAQSQGQAYYGQQQQPQQQQQQTYPQQQQQQQQTHDPYGEITNLLAPIHPCRNEIPFTRRGVRLFSVWIHDSGPATCDYLHIAGEHTVYLE